MADSDFQTWESNTVWDPVLGRWVDPTTQSYSPPLQSSMNPYTPAAPAASVAKPAAPADPWADYKRHMATSEAQGPITYAGGDPGSPGPGYDFYRMAQDELSNVAQQVRVLPGVRPYIGYIPGHGAVDLRTMLPATEHVSPTEQAVVDFFSGRPQSPFPRFADTPMFGSSQGFSGRGYQYSGDPSEREQELQRLLQAGQVTPQTLLEYDKLSRPRIRENQKAEWRQWVDRIYPAVITAITTAGIGSAAGGAMGALASAGWGGLSAAAQTGFKDWESALVGTAAGALGGWGAGQGAQALGFGPTATGIASGAGGGFASSTARGAVEGEFDSGNILTSTAIGGAAGGAGAATGLPSQAFSMPFNTAANIIRDDEPRPRRRSRNPYA